MKRLILSLALLLSVAMGALAQNNAMYVYRNDGAINAFLKSEVDSVRYSALDLDSVSHKDYVVQEVWTVDSIYRIPLNVIDSVSFVTPPTIYKSDAVVINQSMLDYIVGVDSLTLFFKKATPSSVLPKVNDKLIFLEVTDILPYGFMGQVSDISSKGDSISIACSALTVTDVLEQYYSFSSIDTEKSSVKSSSSGAKKITKAWGPKTFTATPSHIDFTPFVIPDIYPDPEGDFSFNVTPKIEEDITPTYTGSAYLIVSPTMGVVFNINIKEEYKDVTTFKLSGKVDLTKDLECPVFEIPLGIPLVDFYGEIGAFFRAEASGAFKNEHTRTFRNTLNIEYSSRNLFVPQIQYNHLQLPATDKTEFMVNGSVGVGLYAELGIKIIDKNFASIGFRGEAGIKLGGDAVLYQKDTEKAFHSTEVYNALLNTNIHLSAFAKIGSQAKFFCFGASHDFKPLTKEYTLLKVCPVPTFTDTKLEREQDSPTTLFSSTKVSGYTLPTDLGFTLFEGDSSEGVAETGTTSYNTYDYMGPQSEMYASFFDMKSTGGYTVYPTVKLWGVEMIADPKAELSLFSCPDENHPHAIDLGLPSGTKWCCCNVGASTPEGYGGYYAWGETSEKSVYNEVTYAYCSGEDTDGDGGYEKNRSYQNIGSDIAGTSYDVATVRMGGSWRMPSHDQQMELMSYCTPEWTQQNGVNGILVTGPSGGQIFLPAAGYRWDDYLFSEGSYGNYWSSTLYPDGSDYACSLYFYSGSWGWSYDCRKLGLSVRAVCP